MNDFLLHCLQHLELAGGALFFGSCIGTLIGVIAYEIPLLARPCIGLLATLRVIPSLAVLMLLLPWLGIGVKPAIVALTLLAMAPVAIAVESALHAVPGDVREAACAMGISAWELRRRITWPLATPRAWSGVRIAAVEAVAGATLAAFVGGGGLGEYIVEGLATEDVGKLLEGALAIAALAWLTEFALASLQRRMEYPQ